MDRKRGWWAYAGVAFVSLVLALGLYVEAYCTLVRPTDCTDWVASMTTRCPADDLTVTMFEPVNSTVPDVYVASEAMIPLIPVCAPPTFGPLIVTAFPFCETVMLLPPAKVIVPDEICAITPAVFPDSVTLWTFCV